jgi:acetylornithine deacetylase/succinyl-diaminopimelate desuccinylase-like protein
MTLGIIDRDYLINTLIDFVRIDSTNPSCTKSSTGEGEIAHYVLKTMQNIGS